MEYPKGLYYRPAPNVLSAELHNLLFLMLTAVLMAWVAKLCKEAVELSELLHGLKNNKVWFVSRRSFFGRLMPPLAAPAHRRYLSRLSSRVAVDCRVRRI